MHSFTSKANGQKALVLKINVGNKAIEFCESKHAGYNISYTYSCSNHDILKKTIILLSHLLQNHQLKTARLEKESTPKSRTFLTVLKSFCTGFSSTPETKLFFLFWYYIFVAVVLYAYFTVVLQQASTRADHLYEYFNCSFVGYKPECEVYKEKLNDVTLAGYVLDLITTMLLCSVTLSNLVYVLQYVEVKKFLLKFFTAH